MQYSKKLLMVTILSVMSNARAGIIPVLLDADLNGQSIYAHFGVTLGQDTDVGGNMQGASPITIGINSIVGGNVQAGTVVLTGAGSSVGGYIKAGTSVDTGVGSVVEGNIYSGTTTNTGGSSIVEGDIEAGGKFQLGAAAVTNGSVSDFLANDLDYVPPSVIQQGDQLGVVQETLRLLGVGNSTALDITFGETNRTLTSGIYDSLNYLTIRAGRTLTLDGENKEGDFLFNVHNYLDFASGATVKLVNFTDSSKVIWNVLGDVTGTAGYMQAAAGVSIRGFVFARGYIGTGADTTIFGIGNSCGGAASGQQKVGFGARNTIGAVSCISTFEPAIVNLPVPKSLWLYTLGLIGLIAAYRQKKRVRFGLGGQISAFSST
jgi:hypothetical protein